MMKGKCGCPNNVRQLLIKPGNIRPYCSGTPGVEFALIPIHRFDPEGRQGKNHRVVEAGNGVVVRRLHRLIKNRLREIGDPGHKRRVAPRFNNGPAPRRPQNANGNPLLLVYFPGHEVANCRKAAGGGRVGYNPGATGKIALRCQRGYLRHRKAANVRIVHGIGDFRVAL